MKLSKMNAPAGRVIVASLLAGFLFLAGCQADKNQNPDAGTVALMALTASDYQKKQSMVENFSAVLAQDINQNEPMRREIFTKIAARFDGDFNTLFRHLSAETRQSLFAAARAAGYGSSLDEIEAEVPGIQIMMPFLDEWSDAKIRAAGGLVAVAYPLGEDDQSVNELAGFDQNGNRVTITEENAREIPYVVIGVNERSDPYTGRLIESIVDEDGQSSGSGLSVTGEDPATIEIGTGDWADVPLRELAEESEEVALDYEAAANRLLLGVWNFLVGPTLHASTGKYFAIERFRCTKVSMYENRWTKGAPEFRFAVERNGKRWYGSKSWNDKIGKYRGSYAITWPTNYGPAYRNSWKTITRKIKDRDSVRKWKSGAKVIRVYESDSPFSPDHVGAVVFDPNRSSSLYKVIDQSYGCVSGELTGYVGTNNYSSPVFDGGYTCYHYGRLYRDSHTWLKVKVRSRNN